jgi:hypothetical protein
MHLQVVFYLVCVISIASCHTIFVQLEVEGTTYREKFIFRAAKEKANNVIAITHGIWDPTYDGV